MSVRLVTSAKAYNAVQVSQELNTNINNHISTQTVSRTLKNMVMKAVVKGKKPVLSARHKSQRLDFALQHQYWTIDELETCNMVR